MLTSSDRSKLKLVANLPYNIASPLIIELLIAGVRLLAFTVQKEVADRLRAKENSEAYGPLSVMAQMLAEVEVLRTLPPQAFWPMPKIESALVRMRRNDRTGGRAGEFGRFVSQLFSFRRKTLRKALAQMELAGEELAAKVGIDSQLRPEALSPAQVFQLFEASGAGQSR
jgi:16S rRNA (adenine1518-N6/adenine1519-N6)-dimethyltransferase